MILLRLTQSSTFRTAEGVIFLTQYAHDAVLQVVKCINGHTTVIPHGIDGRFICSPRKQLSVDHYSFSRPFRILYVSTVDLYKHQWHVVEAVALLRKTGLPVELELVGSASHPGLNRLNKMLGRTDTKRKYVRYLGAVPYNELHTLYQEADAFVFASSCETFGQILIEAMSAGLPIACSNCSAMPELLGDGGLYFNPEKPAEIASAIRQLIINPELRYRLACKSFEQAQKYSWIRCATETFNFFSKVASEFPGKGDKYS